MDRSMRKRLGRVIGMLTLIGVLVSGCTPLDGIFTPSAPVVGDGWQPLLKEIRAFERTLGFQETRNFAQASETEEQLSFCGYVSQFHLPYSYEDPAIYWRDAVSEQECLEHADGGDVFFGTVEALGEVEMPVTPAIMAARLDRFVYLVIHEDCHDQFDLPYGIEEPLCELISYAGMPAFADRQYTWGSRAHRAIKHYAEQEARRAYSTVALYEQLAALYARHRRKEISAQAVLDERAVIFAEAERSLARATGTMNNVGMANDMTYSRHYPFLESVHLALGRDLARTVAFFKQVDRMKPTRTAVMKQHGITDDRSLEAIRAYEAAVLDTATKALLAAPPPRP